jgi:rubredoxin
MVEVFCQVFCILTIYNVERAMETWKCNKCGNTIDVVAPPETCPSCKAKCEFINVSCYTPDCGGPNSGNVDEKVFQESYKTQK